MDIELPEKISPLANFRAAVGGVVFLQLLAFPFDNALFHFATFLLVFLAGLTLNQTTFLSFLSILREDKYVHAGFMAIITVMVISNLVNAQNGVAWRTLATFIFRYWLLLFVLLYFHKSRLLTTRTMALAIFVSLIVQFLPFLPEIFNGSIFSTRFQGFTNNPNIVGLFAAAGVLLGLFCIKNNGKYMVQVWVSGASLAVLSSIMLIASGSRGSWVALLGALIIFVAFEARKHPVIITAFVATIASLCFVVFSNFSRPMHRLNLLIEGYPSLRDQVWQNALELFWEKPFLGFGLDTRAHLSANHAIYSEHNIFLSVLTALGTFGLAAYSFLLSSICIRALKNKNSVGLSLMTLLLGAGMFSFDFYRDQHFMIIFIVVIFLILRSHSDFYALGDT